MTPRIFLLTVILTAPPLWAGRPVQDLPFTSVDTALGFALSPLSPSATSIPLPTAENSLVGQIEDLSGRAPNFFVSSTARHSFGDIYSARGLTNGRLLTEPSVGLYVDGVPAGSAFTYSEPLYSIDHVELYRSAQTTLFGLGAEGGLLNIATRHADPYAWHGELSGVYGDFRTVEHRLWLGGPLVPGKLTLELAGFKGTTQGFIDNVFLGGRRDDRDTTSARAVLTWTPQPDWEITAGYEGTRARDGSSRLTLGFGDPFQSSSDEPGGLHLNNHREWLSIRKSFETWQVRSITSHNSWDVNPIRQDVDLTPASTKGGTRLLDIFNPDGTSQSFDVPLSFFFTGETSRLRLQEETWSEEVRFESLPSTPDVPWWKAGLFFQSKRTTGTNDLTNVVQRDDTTVIPLPATVFSFSFPGFPGFSFTLPNRAFTDQVTNIPVTDRTRFSQLAETWAAYGTVGRRWNAFELAAGLRATYTRKEFSRELNAPVFTFQEDSFLNALDQANRISTTLPPGTVGTPIHTSDLKITRQTTRYTAEDDDFNLTPSLGATYDLNKQVQLFGRSTYIVKPGGYNPLYGDRIAIHYGREQIWSTEAGVRASAFNGRLRGQLTGYLNQIKGYQLDVSAESDYLVVNAGRARSLGAELEVAWQLLPGLAISGNFGCNQTHLRDVLPARQAPYVPRYTAFAAVDYAHRIGFRAHAEYVAIGQTDYDPSGFTLLHQGSYGLVNGRIGYENAHYGVYLFGRNLADTKRFTQRSIFSGEGSTGEPRILGVMAMLKF